MPLDRAPRWLRSTFTGWQRPTTRPVDDTGEGAESLVGFVLAAACVGALTGLTAATFRLLLTDASGLRVRLTTRAHDLGSGEPYSKRSRALRHEPP